MLEMGHPWEITETKLVLLNHRIFILEGLHMKADPLPGNRESPGHILCE